MVKKQLRSQEPTSSSEVIELRKVFKLGKSVSITLPKAFADYLKIGLGDYVEVTVEQQGALTIRKHKISKN